MFPAEHILLARGKYSTLGHERRELLKRIHHYCSLLINQASAIMRDSEKDLPDSKDALSNAVKYLEESGNARAELVKVCEQMIEIKDLAWGTMDYDDKSPREPGDGER